MAEMEGKKLQKGLLWCKRMWLAVNMGKQKNILELSKVLSEDVLKYQKHIFS